MIIARPPHITLNTNTTTNNNNNNNIISMIIIIIVIIIIIISPFADTYNLYELYCNVIPC